MGKDDGIRTCFVVSQIGSDNSPERVHADWLLEDIIEPAVVMSEIELLVERADKISQPGLIDGQIIERLIDADLVIADLTGMNPNALYEIGIRHLAQKPIIHMHLEGQKLPFDVSLFRSIKFSLRTPADIRVARNSLSTSIKNVFSKGFKVENPVTVVLGRLSIPNSPTDPSNIMQEDIKSLNARVRNIEDLVKYNSNNSIFKDDPDISRDETGQVQIFISSDDKYVNKLRNFVQTEIPIILRDFGYKFVDKNTVRIFSANTPYNIASISKVFDRAMAAGFDASK